jgi:hypothetical protein
MATMAEFAGGGGRLRTVREIKPSIFSLLLFAFNF